MFFGTSSKGKLILMLEVQSSLVRASIVWLLDSIKGEKQQPHLLLSESIVIPFKQNVSSQYFVKTTMHALKDLIDESQKRLILFHKDKTHIAVPKHIDEVHYVLSSPWVLSQAKTIDVRFDESTEISQDRIGGILNTEREKMKSGQIDESGLEPIEEKIFDVRLNGYSVPNWKGKEAQNLEVSYALTVSSVETVKKLREACEHIASGKKVFFHSSLLLQYVGLKSVPIRNHDNYLLVHIHGELTDIVAVENDSCTFFGSFPVGVHTIVRKLAHVSNSDQATADSLLSLYLGGKLDENHSLAVGKIVADMSAAWIGEFNKVLKMSPLAKGFPTDVVLAGRSHEDFFMKSFKDAFPKTRVQLLSADDIAPKLVYDYQAYRPRLVSLYTLGLCDIM